MSLDYDDKQLPYTAVRIVTDSSDENTRYYEAVATVNDGKTLEIYNPWGTQAMANAILTQINGYSYQPFTADGAFLDDAAELGDGVWVGNIYGPLVTQDIDFNGLGASNISAPGGEDTDNEFDIDYMSSGERSALRSESRTTALIVEQGLIRSEITDLDGDLTSLIEQTATSIRSEISDLDDELSTSIEQRLDSITLSVSSASGSTTFTLKDGTTTLDTKTLNLTVDHANISGLLTASQIDVSTLKVGSGGISVDAGAIVWNNLSTATKNTITGAVSDAEDALDAVGAWTYSGTTYIDGTQIKTGTVTASHLLGGTVSLLASNNTTVGDLSIAYTTTGYGLGITTDYGGIKIESAGNIFLDAGTGGSITIRDNTVVLSAADLLLSSYSFGSSLPASGSYGQVFFKIS